MAMYVGSTIGIYGIIQGSTWLCHEFEQPINAIERIRNHCFMWHRAFSDFVGNERWQFIRHNIVHLFVFIPVFMAYISHVHLIEITLDEMFRQTIAVMFLSLFYK